MTTGTVAGFGVQEVFVVFVFLFLFLNHRFSSLVVLVFKSLSPMFSMKQLSFIVGT